MHTQKNKAVFQGKVCLVLYKDQVPALNVCSQVRISQTRAEVVEQAVGSWNFSAHDFSDEELVHCAQTMFKHAFTMPEVSGFVIPSGGSSV